MGKSLISEQLVFSADPSTSGLPRLQSADERKVHPCMTLKGQMQATGVQGGAHREGQMLCVASSELWGLHGKQGDEYHVSSLARPWMQKYLCRPISFSCYFGLRGGRTNYTQSSFLK